MIDPTAQIHPRALVENAIVGPRTRIWQFASVIRRANIGADCNVASCAIVDGSAVGPGSAIGHGAFIAPGIKLGADVFVGPDVVLCNDFWPRTSKASFDMEAILYGEIVITAVADGASIGARATILPGLTIGRNSMIAAGAVVDRDVPDDCLFRRDGQIVLIRDELRSLKNRMRAVA